MRRWQSDKSPIGLAKEFSEAPIVTGISNSPIDLYEILRSPDLSRLLCNLWPASPLRENRLINAATIFGEIVAIIA
jgi:hypothetical protein